MKIYQRKIVRSSIPRNEYRSVIRQNQQEMLKEALIDDSLRPDPVSEIQSSDPLSPGLNSADQEHSEQREEIIKDLLHRKDNETQLHIARGPHGKPWLPDYPDFHYNFTDSGDWLILAISETDSEIGVDLQKIVPVKAGIMKMARRFFHPDDVALLAGITVDTVSEQEQLFFRIWTVKEAYLKYTGEGLSGGMNRYSVDFEHKKIGGVSFQELTPPAKDYLLSICFRS